MASITVTVDGVKYSDEVEPRLLLVHYLRDRLGIGHPDHRAVGSAALDAVYPDARNPFAFPELLADEGLEAWIVPEVWISGTVTPTHYVDVTQTFPQKIAALKSHVSQVGQRDGLEGFLRERLARAGAQAGLPEGHLAEGYQVIEVG